MKKIKKTEKESRKRKRTERGKWGWEPAVLSEYNLDYVLFRHSTAPWETFKSIQYS